jgi:ribosomal protein S18 acetylase RimI-like enzyme
MNKARMKIQNATLRDCTHIHRLASMPGLANPEGKAPGLFWIKSFVQEKQYAYVIKDKSQVAAFLVGERTCGDLGMIWMIGVDEQYRNRGFARTLMGHAETAMRANGIRVIIAYGYTVNPIVKHMFESLKYRGGNTYTEYVKFLADRK